MKIQEADAKTLLVAQGLPVPDWEVAHTVPEARAAAERILGGRRQRGRDQGPGPRRRARQGRRREARLERRRGRDGRRGDPRHGHQGHHGPQGPRRGGGRHRPRVLHVGGPRSRRAAHPADGLGRGRRRDRAGRGRPPGGDHPAPRRPAPRPARLPGPRVRVRDGPRRPPQGGRRHRQGPRPDDARLRRRPGRDQPAGDRPRDAAPTARASSAWSASTPRSRSTTRHSPAIPASRRCATPTRRTPPIARRARRA